MSVSSGYVEKMYAYVCSTSLPCGSATMAAAEGRNSGDG